MRRYSRIGGLVGLVALLAQGACAPASFDAYQETIAKFQSATAQTASVTTEYFLQLNTFERNLEFERLRDDPARTLDVPKYFLEDKFSAEAIRVRVESFRVIEAYTGMLAELADSDAPDRWAAAADKLKGEAEVLLADLEKVGADQLATLSELATPVTAVVKFVGQEFINMRRARALDQAILKAKPAIEEISRLLKRDMQTVIGQRATLVNLPLIDIIGEYDAAQLAALADPGSKSKEKVRLKVLDRLEQELTEREETIVTLQALEQALDGFDRAHDSLVAYAQSDKGPRNVADLIGAVERYKALAQTLFDSFKELRAEG